MPDQAQASPPAPTAAMAAAALATPTPPPPPRSRIYRILHCFNPPEICCHCLLSRWCKVLLGLAIVVCIVVMACLVAKDQGQNQKDQDTNNLDGTHHITGGISGAGMVVLGGNIGLMMTMMIGGGTLAAVWMGI